jgi:thioredoxin-related protein
MKKILLFLLPVVAIVFLIAAKEPANDNSGIKFYEASWTDVMKKADKENKLIFIDIYATWCGPCKMLKKYTFPNKEVGDYFNANFVNATFDGENGDGVQLAQKYKVQGYPTLIILDEKGNIVSQTAGYLPAENLLAFGKDAIGKKKKK